jgi:hypothetical protein
MGPTRVSFIATNESAWRITRVSTRKGESLLPLAPALQHIEGSQFTEPQGAAWVLHGVRSHERYTERAEKARLATRQEGLGRPASRLGALIPIRKSVAWWDLAQDQRRAIFEERSRHIAVGFEYLPAIARRLYHAREIGGGFDFLTWFEFRPEDSGAFDELLGRLRETEEWDYVDRDIEVRVERA